MQRVIDTRHRLADDPWQVHPTGAPIPDAGDWLFDLADWRSGRTQRISSGFYTSQALEVVR